MLAKELNLALLAKELSWDAATKLRLPLNWDVALNNDAVAEDPRASASTVLAGDQDQWLRNHAASEDPTV